MKRLIKFLHEVGTVGLMGAVLAQMIMSYGAEGLDPVQFATMRHAILLVSEWLLLPSLLVVLVSGLLAMVARPTYSSQGWALLKLAMTVLVMEGTLFAVQGPAQTAATISQEIAAGNLANADSLPHIVRHERGGLLVILVLSLANIALAVWRPRFARRASQADKRRGKPAVIPGASRRAEASP
jgi:hypothetical protein